MGLEPPVALARLVTMTRTVSQRYHVLIHSQEDNKTLVMPPNEGLPSRVIKADY